MQEQISASLQATQLVEPVFRTTVIMDQEKLEYNILSTLPHDPLYIAHQNDPQSQWSVTPDGFVRHDNLIYIPNTNDLQLCISITNMTTYFPDILVRIRQ